MRAKRVLSILAIATVLHTPVLAARPARADTGTDVMIGIGGFLGYIGVMFAATAIWNRSKQPPDTGNAWAASAIDPATLDRRDRHDGVRGPWACKPDAAGLPLVCW